jgi:hypothetical protein
VPTELNPPSASPVPAATRLPALAALLALFLLLLLPNRLSWIEPTAFGFLPLELLVVGLALLAPGRSGTLLRWVCAALLAAGLLCKVADLFAYQVFSRPFNPVFDLSLLADALRLLSGALGAFGAWLVALLMALLFGGILLLSTAVLTRVQRGLQRERRLALPGLLALLLLWGLLKVAGVSRVNHYFYDELVLHAEATVNSMADLRQFRATVDVDPYAKVPDDALLQGLRGKDVVVVFLESYGRVVFDDTRLASVVRPALERAEQQLAVNGLAVRSGWLESPTIGGISWLAHGTLLSGLWIDSQTRYDSLMLSQRPTLNRLFKRAGWRTLAFMPAISMVWPEAAYFGYDQVYDAHNSGYAGLPFNWVTMPDQYVLSALQRFEREPSPRAPLMAEIAMISSHAPWTPTPQLLPWAEVGDGSIFNAQTQAGPTPEEVWQSPQRIRTQYAQSIEYALNTLASFAINFGDDRLVLLVVGDHQPAPLVAGDLPNAHVPVHVIARDAAVIAAIADWQWTPSLLPAADAPVWLMSDLRDRLLAAFSGCRPADDSCGASEP